MSFNLYPVASDYIANHSMTDKVIVLDLDSTLINTQESFESFKSLNIMKKPELLHLKHRCYCIKLFDTEDGSRYDFWGIKRPHLDEFLLFCFNYFKIVIVWSAGTRDYVNAIVNHIFKNLKMPHLVWCKDDVEMDGDKKDIILKPLQKLINADTHVKQHLKLEKIIHVDDNDTTFSKNKKNAIYIPAYEPDPDIGDLAKTDNALLQVKQWCLQPHVIQTDDITKLDMSSIFS